MPRLPSQLCLLIFTLVFVNRATECRAVFVLTPPPSYRLDLAPYNPQATTIRGWNESGQAIYFSIHPNVGFWWDGQEEFRLDSGGRRLGVGEDMNNSGRIAGILSGGSGSTNRAAVWENGTLTIIPQTENTRSRAEAINENGLAAGWFTAEDGQRKLFTWGDDFQEHGELPLGGQRIIGMNNNRQIIGHAITLLDGWLWEDGVFHILPDLEGGDDSSMRDINEEGVIVGASYIGQSDLKAAKWVDKQIIPLPLPDGFTRSQAVSINNSGLIVGEAFEPGTFNSQGAILWDDDESYFLDDLVVDLGQFHIQQSVAILDSGKILAWAVSETQGTRYVILTPVPEPMTCTYVVISLAVYFGAVRRTKS